MRFEQPPPEPLAGALGFLLSWNGQRIARRFAEALQQVGLRPPHFGVMRVVAAQPGRTQQGLLRKGGVSPFLNPWQSEPPVTRRWCCSAISR